MKRITCALVIIVLMTIRFCVAEDTAFDLVKLADAKGRQTNATLIFSDANKTVVVRVADHDVVIIPYDQVDKFSYEYTKKHRIGTGAIVMVASLGAGAIVMLTKSKSHWLDIHYHEKDVAKTVTLRMSKKEYTNILEAAKIHTGKEVEMRGNANAKAKK